MSAADKPLGKLSVGEQLNFLITNRIPRRALTRFMGWYSQLRIKPLTRLSIWVWRQFADDLRLFESAQKEFESLHACFTRTLVPGARPVCRDPAVLASPCDAVVGEFGDVSGVEVLQAKGFPYTLPELLQDDALAEHYRNGRYVTLRLKSSMYHHFHAPLDGEINQVSYISGDTWNVNPIALKKVEKLFCRNERAVLQLQPPDANDMITLVPVAAVLVASMRFHGLAGALNLQYDGPNMIQLRKRYVKGEGIGYFEHGSTVILLTPPQFSFCDGVEAGQTIRMGTPLMFKSDNKASIHWLPPL